MWKSHGLLALFVARHPFDNSSSQQVTLFSLTSSHLAWLWKHLFISPLLPLLLQPHYSSRSQHTPAATDDRSPAMMPAHPPGVIPTPERAAAGSPDAQVERLINAAEHLRSMPPNMQRFMKAYPNFYRTIARHVRILLRRSPIPADGQMTIWDRALLTITRNGADVGSAVPIQFFCEHWCEYDPASGAPTEAMYDMAKLAVLPWDSMRNRSP